MFIIIVLITFALVAYLTIRDRMKTPRISQHSIQKHLKAVSRYVSLGNWQEAKERLAPLIESGRGGKDALLLHIQVLRGTKSLTQALPEVLKAARAYPEELLFRMEEGLVLLEMNRPEEALKAFRVCAPIMRGESDAIVLATALCHSGYPTQAFELLEPWIENTQNGELISLIGDTFFETKQFNQAIDHYLRAIEMGVQTYRLFTQLGHAYRRFGNLSESEKVFRRLLERDPGDLSATLGLGACMQERGHFQKALLIYQSSGAWQTKAPALMKEAGICALKTKKFAYAECYFLEAIRKSEPEASLYVSYAFALENQEKWQEAEQTYLRLIHLFPSSPQGYRGLAWMFGIGLTRTLSQDQGISYAHVALKLKNDLVSWEILSAVEARVGHFEKAYEIQMMLASQDKEKEARSRRSQALRKLRNHCPLEGQHVARMLVA